MNIDHWIKKHSTTVSDKSGFVIGPFIRVVDLQHLMKTHAVVPVGTMLALQAGFHRAAEEVMEWGGYAPDYFQEKHRLTEAASNFTQTAESINALLNAGKEQA